VYLQKIKVFFFCFVIFFLLFSLEGVDISTILCLILIPLINYKNVIFEKSLIVNSFYLFILFSTISILINLDVVELNSIARPLGVFCFSLFAYSNRLILKKNTKVIFTYIIFGVFFFDLIAYVFVFGYGLMQIEGFKHFYPSFRFQGFYNLSISAIFKSFLLALVFYTKPQIKNYLFWPIVLILVSSILLSLTRTSWLVFIIVTFSFLLFKILYYPSYFSKIFRAIFIFLSFIVIVVNVIKLDTITINEVSIYDLFYKRFIVDSFEQDDPKEKERSSLFYPLKLLEKAEIKVFGNGIGTTEKFGGVVFGGEENLGAHNTFVHILLDYGVLSFISFISFFFLTVYSLFYKFSFSTNNIYIFCNILGVSFAFMYQDLDYYLPIMLVVTLSVIFINSKRPSF